MTSDADRIAQYAMSCLERADWMLDEDAISLRDASESLARMVLALADKMAWINREYNGTGAEVASEVGLAAAAALIPPKGEK